MRRILGISTMCLAIATGLVTACGGDDTASPATTDAGKDSTAADTSTPDTGGGDTAPFDVAQEAAASGVTVTVNYAGAQTGTLAIGVFPGTTFPPVVPPVGVLRTPNPTFPTTHTFSPLPAGDYIVAPFLDIGNNNPQSPGPEDLLAAPPFAHITIGSGIVTQSLTLLDSDGGSGDAGDGGDSG